MDFSVIPALEFPCQLEWRSLFMDRKHLLSMMCWWRRFTLDDHEQMRWLQDISQQPAIQALLFCSAHTGPFRRAGELAHAVWIFCRKRAKRNLRFYDTRVFPLLLTHISVDEAEPLMRPARSGVADLDGQAKGIKGSGPHRNAKAGAKARTSAIASLSI